MTFYIVTTGAPRPDGYDPDPTKVVEGPFLEEADAQKILQEMSPPDCPRFKVIEARGGLFLEDFAKLATWTKEQATIAEEIWERSGRIGPKPLEQWKTWHLLLPSLKQQWEAGDSQALILAMVICANERIPAPGWCATDLGRALHNVTYEVSSWDEALGRPRANQKGSLRLRALKTSAKSDYKHLCDTGHSPVDAKAMLADEYCRSVKTIEGWLREKD